LLFYYNYYVEFLSYPDANGSVPQFTKPGEHPKRKQWLPKVIADGLQQYESVERVDDEGIRCTVLEYPEHEAFWFDPEKSYALRRRDSFDPATGDLAVRTTLRDFVELEGVWLPRSIVHEEFGGPDDPTSVRGKVRARKVLRLISISASEIPDTQFVLKAPGGNVVVHDTSRRTFFRHYTSGENPVLSAAEAARKQSRPSNPDAIRISVAVFLAASIVVLSAILLWIRRSSRGI
jgi:hypothetical protein